MSTQPMGDYTLDKLMSPPRDVKNLENTTILQQKISFQLFFEIQLHRWHWQGLYCEIVFKTHVFYRKIIRENSGFKMENVLHIRLAGGIYAKKKIIIETQYRIHTLKKV